MTSAAADRVHFEAVLARHSVEAAPDILGSVLRHVTPAGTVGVRITEVEAYMGTRDSRHPDPGSHGYRGMTNRNAVMFGPSGHLYVYFTYGMHYCANLVCGPAGASSGLLLRGGEVVEGLQLARSRRPAARRDAELAQGPARLASALGLGRADNGRPVLAAEEDGDGQRIELVAGPPVPAEDIAMGPRVGVAGPGGSEAYPWRFWIRHHPTVSRYKAAVVRPKRGAEPG